MRAIIKGYNSAFNDVAVGELTVSGTEDECRRQMGDWAEATPYAAYGITVLEKEEDNGDCPWCGLPDWQFTDSHACVQPPAALLSR